MIFLNINNLNVKIDGKQILKDFNLNINLGEVHAIMGPNGSGKSTLANVIAGNEDYEVESGKIIFKDQDLLDLNIEERSQLGVFLAFQYPVEIPGVNITPFLQAALNSKLKNQSKEEVDNLSFAKLLRSKAEELGINFLEHDVTDADRWQEVIEEIKTNENQLNILVNNSFIRFVSF